MNSKIIIDSLHQLKPDKNPLWGKMTPQHMVEHLVISVKMSNGKLILKCFNPPEKIPALKRFLLSSKPLPKLFENPALGKELSDLEYSSLDEAITILKLEIDDYNTFFSNNPDEKPVNVTFGELSKSEWDFFHQKHFRHHLSQFGISYST